MKKALIVLAIILLASISVWYFVIRDTSQSEDIDETADTTIPVAYSPGKILQFDTFSSEFNPVLSLRYINTWVIAEGADNSADLQIITLESPQDTHEFYFCLNIDDYASDDVSDLSIGNIQVVSVEPFATEGAGKDLYFVTFKSDTAPNDFQIGLTDTPPVVGDSSFVDQITSDSTDRRLQVWGRFNCREDVRPDITLDQFNNSQLLNEASATLASLKY